MDKENVIKAFSSFAEGDYESCKTILNKEIDLTINDYLKTKLELKNDVVVVEPE